MVGQVPDLRLSGFKLADVAGGEQQACCVVQSDRFDRDFDIQQLAALGAPQHLSVTDTALFPQFIEQSLTLYAVAPNAQFVRTVADRLGTAVPGQTGETIVYFYVMACGVVADGDGVRA